MFHHIIIFALYLCFDLFWYLGWYWDSTILSNIKKFASWFVKHSKTFCNHTLNNQQNILKHFTPIQIYKYIYDILNSNPLLTWYKAHEVAYKYYHTLKKLLQIIWSQSLHHTYKFTCPQLPSKNGVSLLKWHNMELKFGKHLIRYWVIVDCFNIQVMIDELVELMLKGLKVDPLIGKNIQLKGVSKMGYSCRYYISIYWPYLILCWESL